MKKQLFIFALLVGSLTASAQQLPLISSYLKLLICSTQPLVGLMVRQRFQFLTVASGRIFRAPETQFMAFNGNQNDLNLDTAVTPSMT